MFDSLPKSPKDLAAWTWPDIEPYFQELQARKLNSESLEGWLADWSRLAASLDELEGRLYVATTVNTADQEAEKRWENYLNTIFTSAKRADQGLKEKLLASGLEPEGFEIPLRNMRAHAELFRQENLPLLAQEQKMSNEYDKIVGAQTFEWQGQPTTIERLKALLQSPDRVEREQAWRLASERQLADREEINGLWERFVSLRLQVATNADLPDYRAYQWQRKLRFDYTPEDCTSFHAAIEQVVVPAAKRLYERRRRQLGLDVLRPWDLVDGWYSHPVEPPGLPPLKPFEAVAELKSKTQAVFSRVDQQFGQYFQTMIDEDLLDLDNRPNKAPGGYCISFIVSKRPFIFMNAVGIHDNVQTLLHEGGHSFHDFEKANIKYYQQMESPMEFNEVASMAMELLASPYLTQKDGGFYSEAEAARARIEHLEGCLLFWPFMAVVDAFQHWVYENPKQGAKPAQCDAKWAELWERFIPSVNWSGLDEAMMSGWHRKLHIHQVPFYYVEYGLAQLGAVQVLANALKDQRGAVAAYRKALSLGGTVTLPELFATAGARFAFDSSTLKQAVDLIESVIEELETKK